MFRPILVSFCVASLSVMALGAGPESTGGAAFDDPAPAAPVTQPVVQSFNAPINPLSTPPANAASAAPANSVVLVLPIVPAPGYANSGVGKAIQQDLVVDLSQMTRARVIAPPSATPAADEQSALDQARQVNAGFVVYGQAQMSGNQLRVIGGVLDVSTAKPLIGLKATAPVDNLFPLEDSLAGQAAHALPYPIGMAGAPQPLAEAPQQQGQPAPYPADPAPQPTSGYTSSQVASGPQGDPYYSYVDAYPSTYYTYNSYYYTYPYWYYPGSVYIGYGGSWNHPYYGHGGGYYYGGRPYYRGGAFIRGGGGFRGGAIRGGGGGRR